MGRRRVGRSAVLAGTACAGALALAAPAAAAERAYELVSPAGGIQDIRPNQNGMVPNSLSGNDVCFASSLPATPDAAQAPTGGTQVIDAYCSHRSASGWATEWISQPRGSFTVALGTPIGASNRFMSDDGSRQTFASHLKIDPSTAPNDSAEAADGYLRHAGTTTLISGPRPAGVDHAPSVAVAATGDLSHLLLTDLGGMARKWSASGGIEIISRDADGDPVPGGVPLMWEDGGLGAARPGALAEDGSSAFFHATGDLVPAADDDGGVRSVFVREGGETRLVSPRRGPGGTTPRAISFVGASADGDQVFLVTTERLTAADPGGGTALYRYVRSTDALELIDSVSDSFGVGQVQAVSESGAVFYVRPDRMLRRYADGVTTNVMQLVFADMQSATNVGAYDGTAALRLTPDGDTAVFQAVGTALPARRGVYRWTEAGGTELLSTNQGGTKVESRLGQVLTTQTGGGDMLAKSPWGQYMTADGETVYFTTATPIVDADRNQVTDVYEWHDGEVRLISPGTTEDHAYYVGNSADGDTVFFTTYQRILPNQDTNHGRDLYAARVGGGFPDPPVPSTGAPAPGGGPAGAAAAPPVTPATTQPVPSSPVPGGFPPAQPLSPGNDPASVATVRVTGAALVRDGQAVRVRVRASTAGDLAVALRRRGEEVASADGSADRAGAAAVTVDLPKALRDRLADGRSVRLVVRVGLTPQDGGAAAHDRARETLSAGSKASRRGGGGR